MTYAASIHCTDSWVEQMLSVPQLEAGGLIRHTIQDVEDKIGRRRLEVEVRQRGFRLVETGEHFLILCTTAPLRVIV
jgi:hypothetical protein